MKKQEEKVYELKDFSQQVHLWNLVHGGSGKGVVLLRKIVDSIQSENYTKPYKKRPSFLIVGEKGTGKNIVSRALVNSLAIEDIRETPAEYFENGIPSNQFFKDSLFDTTHIITNIEQLNKVAESFLWKYLKHGVCEYFNYSTRNYDLIQKCHGIIILTATGENRLSGAIVDAVDHVIELEPYNSEQLKIITHQLLKFCSIEYEGEQILQEIVDQGVRKIGLVIEFLKVCVLTMKAELKDCLDMEIVNRAKRMWQVPVPAPPIPEDIPF